MEAPAIQTDPQPQAPAMRGGAAPAVEALRGRKVLIVLGSLEMGGAQRQAILLARLLKDAGVVVRVWGFWKTTGGAADLCDRLGIPWRIVPVNAQPWQGRRVLRRLNWLGVVLQARRVARAIAEEKADVVVPFYTMANLVCGLAARWAGVRAWVWNQRDTGITMYPRLEGRVARRAPACISNAGAGVEFMHDVYGVDRPRISMVPNGVELSPPRMDRQAWRSRLGAGEHTLVVCMLGNIVDRKDHMTLVEAWRGVVDAADERGLRVLLVLAGYAGNTAAAVTERVNALGLEPFVQMIGETDDVSGLLGAADAGVLSSRIEGTPNGVLECMAAGLAVVATDLPGVREAMGPGFERFVAPPRDVAALRDRLVTILSDAGLRQRAGDANRARIEADYAPVVMLERTAKLLHGLMA